MLSTAELESLKVGDEVDVKDIVNRFLPARVVAICQPQRIIRFHFIGWDEKYDTELDCSGENSRIAHPRTFSAAKGTKFAHIQRGDYVKVFFEDRWCKGKVRRLDAKMGSTQIQVMFHDSRFARKQVRWFERTDATEVQEWSLQNCAPELIRFLASDSKFWIVHTHRFLRPQFHYSSTRPSIRISTKVHCFFQVQNGWIFPMVFDTIMDCNAVIFDQQIVNFGNLRAAIETYVAGKSGKLRQELQADFPHFDHNARRRVTGFLQGWLYQFNENKNFEPEFRVKRKREVPASDLNFIVDLIVEFVPVWGIFRNEYHDTWYILKNQRK